MAKAQKQAVGKKRRRGASTKRTPERVAGILKAIEKGLPYKLAAEAAGIHEGTLHEWRQTIPEFSMQVRQAEIKAISRSIECLEKAARRGDWRAATWLLERREPEHFGRESAEKSPAKPSSISIGDLLYDDLKPKNPEGTGGVDAE